MVSAVDAASAATETDDAAMRTHVLRASDGSHYVAYSITPSSSSPLPTGRPRSTCGSRPRAIASQRPERSVVREWLAGSSRPPPIVEPRHRHRRHADHGRDRQPASPTRAPMNAQTADLAAMDAAAAARPRGRPRHRVGEMPSGRWRSPPVAHDDRGPPISPRCIERRAPGAAGATREATPRRARGPLDDDVRNAAVRGFRFREPAGAHAPTRADRRARATISSTWRGPIPRRRTAARARRQEAPDASSGDDDRADDWQRDSRGRHPDPDRALQAGRTSLASLRHRLDRDRSVRRCELSPTPRTCRWCSR